MANLLFDIEEFQKFFGYDMPKNPQFLERNFMTYRMNHIREELDELLLAVHDDDLEKAFDALIDITYLTLGTAYVMGLPFGEGWNRVHEANMLKVNADGPNDPRSKRNSTFDIVKPLDWEPPRLLDLISTLDDEVS